jgi:hypothetical protein
MSYDQKIAAAQNVIEQHNANADSQIDFDEFTKKLRELGGSSEEALKAASFEDLHECGIPKIMARRLTYLFRKDGDEKNGKSTYISEKKVVGLSYRELVERYNPKDVKNPVGWRLKDLSGGKKFIVFNNDGKVIVKETVLLLEDIINGLPEIDRTFVRSIPHMVYEVGDRPDAYLDENPLYPGRPLRSGETCDQTGRSWAGVDPQLRQFILLAISRGEMSINTVADAHDVLDKVLSQKDLNTWRSRCPNASIVFDEMKTNNTLPTLRIKMSHNSGSNSNSPFGRNTTY